VIKIYPLVSICCTAYNHEKYIADAIESFLMQKTNFPIEIIIHDDASTDNTAEIIREYEKLHPKIIKPIYQKENQYSQGVKVSAEIVWAKVKGKYIALCEGDDFWTEPLKLQKQIDFIESQRDYVMCFHAVKVVDTIKNPIGRHLGPYGKGSKEYTIKENVIGGFVHVSSVVMKTELVKDGMPKWYLNSRHGDFALALYLSAKGKTYYIDEEMSSHRVGVENSLMTKIRQNYSKENEINYQKQRISTINEANKFYGYRYHFELEKVNLISEVKILLLENRFKELRSNKYKDFFDKRGIKGTIKFIIINKFPKLARLLSKLKNKYLLNIASK